MALKQVQEMNLQISQSTLIFDKIVERLRMFLMHVYGPKFDKAYLAIRDVDPSPKSKQAMTVPLIELAMFTYFQNVAKGQSDQINIMSLLKGYSGKTSKIFDPL